MLLIMYFTIENPDLKMLESYHDAKQYAEDLNIEKQMFIYNISQDMKIPLIKTSKYCENLLYSDDLNTYKDDIRGITTLIERQENVYSPYFVDEEMLVRTTRFREKKNIGVIGGNIAYYYLTVNNGGV